MSVSYFKRGTSIIFLLMDIWNHKSDDTSLSKKKEKKILFIPFVKPQMLSHIEPAKFHAYIYI